MGEYHIRGGRKLSGKIEVGGGKNAILPILAATVLNYSKCVIHNCPLISDTFVTIKILEATGCKVKLTGHTIEVDSSFADSFVIPENLVHEMRSSIIFLGSVLGRFKNVVITYPGGCELGLRPIDLHLKGLKALGTNIVEDQGFIYCDTDALVGTKINLDFPSVGATENIMLAAVSANGTTEITNAAMEPEIVDLQNFLKAMGAKISGAGSSTIVIEGGHKLHSAEYTVMTDRIVTGTFLVAAAITGGEVEISNVDYASVYPIITKLEETGCIIKVNDKDIYLTSPIELSSVKRLKTLPHPGFPTDMQPQFMALLTIANGSSLVEETVFESRNKHVGELIRMGADIMLSQDGLTSLVKGVYRLKGTTVTSKDLRGGAALILAGLAADGETIVTNSKHVERGYENIELSLQKMGADISFES